MWAATWLYRATGEAAYLQKATALYSSCCKYTGGGAFSWDSKAPGAQLLLYEVTGDAVYGE